MGVLRVIKDMGLKEPYVGQTELQSGEIAEDLTYYFATSEQVPSSVGLGVLMEKDNTVKQAGGFIIQLMPFTEEAVIGQLEKNLAEFSTVTKVLDEGKTPEEMLQMLLAGMDPVITEQSPCGFRCDCSRHRVEKAIISIGKKDIQDMIDDGQEIEVNCHFCNTAYKFSVEELKGLLRTYRIQGIEKTTVGVLLSYACRALSEAESRRRRLSLVHPGFCLAKRGLNRIQ